MFIADVGGGAMSAVTAVLAALFQRERTGVGEALDISMHDALVYWLMLPAAPALVPGGEMAAGALPTFGRHATYNVYDTRDGGRVALGALEPKFWAVFCETVGRPEWRERQTSGPEDQGALLEDVRALFLTRTRDEWLALFAGRAACLSPVKSASEVLADPHVAARRLVVEAATGPGAGVLRAIRAPFVSEPAPLSPAPALGQHTRDFLG
jgi:crotonobetainyl-CoA:carnitine CoA-transferase CaiB-like acyl-CoA transferase